MNKLFDQQKQPAELNLINGFEGEESKEFNNLSDIEQNKVQMEAVAAAAAFLLSFPSENPTNSKISQINGKEEKQNSSFKTIIRHPPLQPISQKGNRWIHLGTFETEEEMHRVRNKEKVNYIERKLKMFFSSKINFYRYPSGGQNNLRMVLK